MSLFPIIRFMATQEILRNVAIKLASNISVKFLQLTQESLVGLIEPNTYACIILRMIGHNLDN